MANVDDSRQVIAGAGLTGGGDLTTDRTFDIVPDDASIAVTTDGISVGVLQSDAQHGDLGGGALHAVATTSVAGFMAAADKVILNQLKSDLVDAEVALSNANATLAVGGGKRYRLAAATLTASRTIQLSTTGAVAGDTITIIRDDLSYYHLRIIQAGPGAQIWDMAGPGAFVAEYNGSTWIPRHREQVPGERVLNVRDFGAVGDGTTPDDAAIQAAINAALVDGARVHIPPGYYKITQTLAVQDGGSNPMRGLHIFGHNQVPTGFTNTWLIWHGNSGEPMLKMHTSRSRVQGLAFFVSGGSNPLGATSAKNASCAIDIDKSQLSGAGIGSQIEVIDCAIHGSIFGGTMTDGVVIGGNSPAASNLEFNRFRGCNIDGCVNACLKIASTTHQSKSNTIVESFFNYSARAIHLVTGSYYCRDCAFTGLTDTIFYHEHVAEPIVIENMNSEGCNNCMQSTGAEQTSIRFIGCRFDLQKMDALDHDYSGYWISCTNRGMLTIRDCAFGSGEGYVGDFRVLRANTSPCGVLISEGNIYPNLTPFDHGIDPQRLYSIGDQGYDDGSSQYKLLGDQIGLNSPGQGDLVITTGNFPAASGSIRMSKTNEININSGVTPGLDLKALRSTAADILLHGDSANTVGHETHAKTGGVWKWLVNGLEILRLGATQILFDKDIASPTITQTATSGGTGTPLIVAAQDAATNGGTLRLKGGSGSTNQGVIESYSGATLLGTQAGFFSQWVFVSAMSGGMSLIANGDSRNITLQTLGTGNYISLQSTLQIYLTSTAITFRDSSSVMALEIVPVSGGASQLLVAASVTSWTMGQSNNTTNGATAATWTIRAQNATGTTSTGGSLSLESGSGTSAAGSVSLKANATTRIQVNGTGIGFYGSTPAAQPADIGALTDNSGGTANTTIEALPDPADAPADADALRDDLVANLIPALRNNIADLTAQVNALRNALRSNGLMA